MDPGQDPHSKLFSELIVISAVNIIGVLNDPVPIYTEIIFLHNWTIEANSIYWQVQLHYVTMKLTVQWVPDYPNSSVPLKSQHCLDTWISLDTWVGH